MKKREYGILKMAKTQKMAKSLKMAKKPKNG